MKANVGRVDRIIRIVVGLGIVMIGLATKSWWGAIGIVPLATAAISWCPLYRPFGISTCRVRETRP